MNSELMVHVITEFDHGLCEIYDVMGYYVYSQDSEDLKLHI
jgi:hypothetical protein